MCYTYWLRAYPLRGSCVWLPLRCGIRFSSVSDPFGKFNTSPPRFTRVLPHSKMNCNNGCAAIGTIGDDAIPAHDIMSELEPHNKTAHQHRLFGRTENDLGGIDV